MIKITVAIAAAVVPWLILLTINRKVAIREVELYAITLLNVCVAIGSAALSLKTGTVMYWPSFILGYMFFAVPIFGLAMIGSLVESNNEHVREVEDAIRTNMIVNSLKKGRN